MGSTSSTGKGQGASDKLSNSELGILANAPSIIFTGIIEANEGITSPPATSGTVTFPYPLDGPASNYVIMLTTINGGVAFVSALYENEDSFTGFSATVEADCDLMYLVAKVGTRPNL
jgi:hypothetical protein